jgi:hypothetical protein
VPKVVFPAFRTVPLATVSVPPVKPTVFAEVANAFTVREFPPITYAPPTLILMFRFVNEPLPKAVVKSAGVET